MPVSSRSRRWLPLSFFLALAVFCIVEQSNASTAAISVISSMRQQQQQRWHAQGLRGQEETGEGENPPENEDSGEEVSGDRVGGDEVGEGSSGEKSKVNPTPEAEPASTAEGGSTNANPPTPAPVPAAVVKDVCAKAKTCEKCIDASKALPEEEKNKYVCVFGIGIGQTDGISCHKEEKDDQVEPMCSGAAATTPPVATDPNPIRGVHGEENSGAMAVKIIGGIALLICVCCFAKSKLSGGGVVVSGVGAPLSIGKAAMYQEVAVEEEDEDWGWDGGGDNGGGGGGDLEMAGRSAVMEGEIPYYTDDTPIKRRTSNDNSPAASPAPSFSKGHTIPSMSVMASGPTKLPSAPRSSPPPMSFSATTPAVSSGSSTSADMYGGVGDSMSYPTLQPITSFGKKAPARPIALKPKKQEDDVFAAFGLAAKPTFTQPVGSVSPTRTAPSSADSAGRWGQTPSTSAVFAGTTATLGGASKFTTTGSASGMDEADDNWDDGDLDDLLDD